MSFVSAFNFEWAYFNAEISKASDVEYRGRFLSIAVVEMAATLIGPAFRLISRAKGLGG